MSRPGARTIMRREGFTPKHRVFISYARKGGGEEFATNLRKRLQNEEPGITLWQDRAEMEGGGGWRKHVDEAPDRGQFLGIVMPPPALEPPKPRQSRPTGPPRRAH